MPKKAYLSAHFQPSELKHKYLSSKDPVEARRWGLIWKVAVGWTIKNTTIALGINYQYAKKIVKKYNELGAKGIKNRKQKKSSASAGKTTLIKSGTMAKINSSTVAKTCRWRDLDSLKSSEMDRKRNPKRKTE